MSRNHAPVLLAMLAVHGGCGGGGGGGQGSAVEFPLAVALAGAGAGRVTSAPAGISCGQGATACGVSAAQGSTWTLTAAPAAGSRFDGWSGPCSGTGPCTVTVGAETHVTATFGVAPPSTWTLTVSVAGTGAGTVNSSPAGISCASGGVGTCSAGFPDGTVVTLTQGAGSGSSFAGWSGGCSGGGACAPTLAGDVAVTATFDLAPPPSRLLTVNVPLLGVSTLVTSVPSGISCSGGACNHAFPDGTVVSLVASSPMGDAAFLAWSGACAGADPAACSVTMSADRTVSSSFAVLRTLSVNAVGDGGVTSDVGGIACGTQGATCAAQVVDGTVVTLSAAPGPGQAVRWGGDCFGSTGLTCALVMDMDLTATITFVPLRRLDVARAGAGSGTVTSTPAGVGCGATCSATFEDGTSVTLVAVPDASSSFSGWSGACTGTGSCALAMTADRSVTATFTPLWTLSVSSTAGGRVLSTPAGIDCQDGTGACAALFVDATAVALVASASPGFLFTGWAGACTGTGPCSVTLAADRAVSATFTAVRTLTVVPEPAEGGTVTSDLGGVSCGATCAATFLDGAAVILTATPSAGWRFTGWSGGGCTGTGTCALSMGADATVRAGFDGPFDFSVSQPVVAGQALSLLPGEARDLPVTLGLARGAGLPVTLSASGLTAGVTASFNPASVTPPGTATLTLTASAGAALTPATAPIVSLTGTSGATVHAASLELEVRSPRGLKSPSGVAIEPGGATALVTEVDSSGYGIGRLVRVGVARRLALRTIASGLVVGGGAPSALGTAHDLALADAGTTAWVVHSGGLSKIDVPTGVIVHRAPVNPATPATALTCPWGLALLDANTALVTDASGGCGTPGRVVKVDLATGTVTPFPVAMALAEPRGIALEPGGKALVVESGWTGAVKRVTVSGTYAGTTVAVVSGLSSLNTVTVEPGGATALVAGGLGVGWGGGRVYRVQLATGTATEIIGTNSNGHFGLALEAGATTALLTQEAPGALLRAAVVSPSQAVAPAFTSVATLQVPTGLAVDAAGTKAYVTDCVGGNCDTASELASVDVATGQVTQVITGMAQLRGVVLEAGEATALVSTAQAGVGMLYRVDLGAGSATLVASFAYSALDVSLEPGGATAMVLSGTRVYRVAVGGALPATPVLVGDVRLTCPGGTASTGATGLVVEAAGRVLVTRTCDSATSIVRFDDSGGGAPLVTVVSSGFAPLSGIGLGAAGSALVTESAQAGDRLLEVDLATGGYRALALPEITAQDLVRTAAGDVLVLARRRVLGDPGVLLHVPATAAFGPAARFHDLDRPAGLALEAGGATVLVAACNGASNCANAGQILRLGPATGAVATLYPTVGTGLNFQFGGGAIALQSPTQLLVTDCGAANGAGQALGRVLRLTDGGASWTVGAPLASGLTNPAAIAVEDATFALVADAGTGTVWRVFLDGSGAVPVATGLSSPTFVVPEVPGMSALTASVSSPPGDYYGKLYRVDLNVASGSLTEVAAIDLSQLVIEPGLTPAGDRTALAMGRTGSSVSWRSLYRINLDTGGIDLLAPGQFDGPQAMALDPVARALWFTEQKSFTASWRGGLFTWPVP